MSPSLRHASTITFSLDSISAPLLRRTLKHVLKFTLILNGLLYYAFNSEANSAANSEVSGEAELQLKAVIFAGSIAELRSSQALSLEYEKEKSACRFQLKNKQIPAACFKVLAIEASRDLKVRNTGESTFDWLTDLCQQRVRETTRVIDLKLILEIRESNNACRAEAKDRLEILRYKAKESDPASVFEQRNN